MSNWTDSKPDNELKEFIEQYCTVDLSAECSAHDFATYFDIYTQLKGVDRGFRHPISVIYCHLRPLISKERVTQKFVAFDNDTKIHGIGLKKMSSEPVTELWKNIQERLSVNKLSNMADQLLDYFLHDFFTIDADAEYDTSEFVRQFTNYMITYTNHKHEYYKIRYCARRCILDNLDQVITEWIDFPYKDSCALDFIPATSKMKGLTLVRPCPFDKDIHDKVMRKLFKNES